MPYTLFFLFKMALSINTFLWFHTNFDFVFPSSVKNVLGDLVEIILNLFTTLCIINIYTGVFKMAD